MTNILQIKSLNDVDGKPLEIKKEMSLKEKDEEKLKPIIDAFKETEENESNR